MNTDIISFRALIDEMKATAEGRKKPADRRGKNTYASAAARDFASRRAGANPGVKGKQAGAAASLDITSLSGVTRLMSPDNQALMQLIAKGDIKSVADLAAKSHRAESNLSRTLKKFEAIGLLRLAPGQGRAKVPQLTVTSFAVTIDILSGKVLVTGMQQAAA